MKLSAAEKRAVDLLRKLDANQRREVLDDLTRQAQANEITAKIARIKRVRTSPNYRVAQVYGLPRKKRT